MLSFVNQVLLLLVIVTLTSLLVVAGVQVIRILKEFRFTLKKLNRVLDDFGEISASVAKPIVGASGFLMGLKNGADLLNLFLNKKKRKNSDD